jgi:hypothetical protein
MTRTQLAISQMRTNTGGEQREPTLPMRGGDALWRWLWPVALLAVVGCGRTQSTTVLRILSVTSEVQTASPGQLVPVVVTIDNQSDHEIRLVEVLLFASPSDAGFRAVPRPTDSSRIEPHTTTQLSFAVSLPSIFDVVTIDAELLAMSEWTDEIVRLSHAETPLTLRRPTPDLARTDLVVTTTDDELDGATDIAAAGGTLDLSLREAVAIANARPGPDEIQFDPIIFQADLPGIIDLDWAGLGSINVTDADTTIDAEDRGVVLRGPGSDQIDVVALDVRAERFVMNNLVVEDSWRGIWLEDAASSLLSANNFRSTWTAVEAVNCSGSRFVGNIIKNATINLAVTMSDHVTIDGNDSTGYGALTLNAVTDSTVVNNIFTIGGPKLLHCTGVEVSANLFADAPGASVTVTRGSSANRIFSNRFSGCDYTGSATGGALWISELSYDNTLSQNLFQTSSLRPAAHQIRIEAGSNRDVAPPTITSMSPTVSGTSAAPAGSVIEVFMDPYDQAGTFVGTATIPAGGVWSVTPQVGLVSGQSLRATATDVNGSTSELSLPLVIP